LNWQAPQAWCISEQGQVFFVFWDSQDHLTQAVNWLLYSLASQLPPWNLLGMFVACMELLGLGVRAPGMLIGSEEAMPLRVGLSTG
jgi:hypothetical protein